MLFIATKAHEIPRKVVDVLLSPDSNSNGLVTQSQKSRNYNLCETQCLCVLVALFFAMNAYEMARKFLLPPKHMKEHEKYYCHENIRKSTKTRRKPYKNLCEPQSLCVFPDCIRDRSGVIFCHESTRNDTKDFYATKAHE